MRGRCAFHLARACVAILFHCQKFSDTEETLLEVKSLFGGCVYKYIRRNVIEVQIGWMPAGLGWNRCQHIHPGEI